VDSRPKRRNKPPFPNSSSVVLDGTFKIRSTAAIKVHASVAKILVVSTSSATLGWKLELKKKMNLAPACKALIPEINVL